MFQRESYAGVCGNTLYAGDDKEASLGYADMGRGSTEEENSPARAALQHDTATT